MKRRASEPPKPITSRPLVPLPQCRSEAVRPCADYERPRPAPSVPTPTADPAVTPSEPVQVITAADIAAFRPTAAAFSSDLPGVGIVNAPTNLVAAIAEHEVPGELFDQPVTVRFVPVSFAFDYGDGDTATRPTGGASWRQLGQAALTPTATSHVYRDRGEVTATVTVTFAASVDAGDGTWRAVQGTVTGDPAATTVRVYEAHTALVTHTCAENPSAIGCS